MTAAPLVVRAITPIVVSDEEVRRRQARYDELAPPGVRIVLQNLPEGPRHLDAASACRDSEGLVVRALLATDPARFDAVLADCVLDPGLEVLERQAPVPAFGMLKLSASTLAASGARFGAVARNRAIADELEERVYALGYGAAFDRVAVLDLSLEDIADTSRWDAAITRVAPKFEERGTRVLLNGCSAVEVVPRDGGLAVVDPTALALSILGLLQARGAVRRARTIVGA